MTEAVTRPKRRSWTEEEDQFLREWGTRLKRKEIAFQLRRTASSVTSRLHNIQPRNGNGAHPASEQEEGQPFTLATAIQGMNHNADALADIANLLREARSRNAELRSLFEIALMLIDKLWREGANQAGRTPLCDVARAFTASLVESPLLKE